MLNQTHLNFLQQLKQNNNRPWFNEHKAAFDKHYSEVKAFLMNIYNLLQDTDMLEPIHIHRIYRNLQFSKDKTPYKTHFSLHIGRTKPLLRGGYFLNIEPGNSFAAGGFWKPEAADLLRFRKEVNIDATPLRAVLSAKTAVRYFGALVGEELRTVPAGFNKDSDAIDLLRKKQWLLIRRFADPEVVQKDFGNEVVKTFHALRPFFDYMSEVLTTDENGESLFG
ncbi:MAG TPA: DUF2461 domain-containing protein [Saprospiraceae bacterium]|nr:DUF2461 domain-containing protein [Saprospiraceae bacterium]MCC6689472.1 DUF2461 domain-containing protein [Saprospiraceae bacterium]HMV24767.1 DUF2461 domain-containing protein [Saprospiraceae bacterium]HMX84203.1 DUF2461 domain-containing protein [Saprospiraceae bacterium]HMX86799.1 DUF2461 domain-containing protein [Saprospiraceae bacterium]